MPLRAFFVGVRIARAMAWSLRRGAGKPLRYFAMDYDVTIKRNLIRVLAIGGALLLAACGGTPSRFLSDVEVFNKGVKKAAAVYRDEREFYVSYLEGLETRVLIRKRPALVDGPELGACKRSIADWEIQWDSNKGVGAAEYGQGLENLLNLCKLHKKVGNATEPLPIKVGDPTPNHTRLSGALERYANALAELANSVDDRKAFNEAATRAKDNLLGLPVSARSIRKTLNSQNPLNIDKELSAIGSILVDAIGASLEARRRRALGRIIKATHPVVVEVRKHMAAITRFYHLAAIPKLATDYERGVMQIGLPDVRASKSRYGKVLGDIITSHEALIVYARADPGKIFDSMETAHKALGLKLEDPATRLDELAGSLQDFTQRAEEFSGAMRNVRVKLEGRAQP